jgi:hypothetical protein
MSWQAHRSALHLIFGSNEKAHIVQHQNNLTYTTFARRRSFIAFYRYSCYVIPKDPILFASCWIPGIQTSCVHQVCVTCRGRQAVSETPELKSLRLWTVPEKKKQSRLWQHTTVRSLRFVGFVLLSSSWSFCYYETSAESTFSYLQWTIQKFSMIAFMSTCFLVCKTHLLHVLKFMKLGCILHLMASKNRCRQINIVWLKCKEYHHGHNTSHAAVYVKIATEKIPEVFVWISFVKNVVTFDNM